MRIFPMLLLAALPAAVFAQTATQQSSGGSRSQASSTAAASAPAPATSAPDPLTAEEKVEILQLQRAAARVEARQRQINAELENALLRLRGMEAVYRQLEQSASDARDLAARVQSQLDARIAALGADGYTLNERLEWTRAEE